MPSSLGRRPQATVFSVEDLIERVRRGEVRVPRFQRRLNWRAKDIKLLFDSIYRGYPVGSLLFWKRAAPADSVKLGPITVDAPAMRDALWVVDGQQRITSMVGVLLHPDPIHGRDDYALGIDLQDEEFIRSRSSLPKSWMPLNVVLDTTRLLSWLDAYELRSQRPEHVITAHRVAKALRDYQLPAYVIEENDESLVRDVFGRLNSAGRKLTPDEVFDALAGSEDSSSASTLQAISDSVANLGFGRFERAWILKSVLAVAGLDITKSGGPSLPRDIARKAHTETERALRDTVVFLRRDAGIQHVSLLPYSLPTPILAKFFHRHPSPRARSRDLLARWVWRGAITGDHQGESIPEIRKMFASSNESEEDAVQSLLGLVGRPLRLDGLGALAPFAWRTARTKLEINALLALGPRDLSTGQPINAPEMLDERGASAFQQIETIRTRTLQRALRKGIQATVWGTLANRYLYRTTEPFSTLLARALSLSEAESVLKSHAFPKESALEFLRAIRSDGEAAKSLLPQAKFLTERDQALVTQVGHFLLSKARWHETDRPSLEALIIPDPEPADA
jgi:hypothetical protein